MLTTSGGMIAQRDQLLDLHTQRPLWAYPLYWCNRRPLLVIDIVLPWLTTLQDKKIQSRSLRLKYSSVIQIDGYSSLSPYWRRRILIRATVRDKSLQRDRMTKNLLPHPCWLRYVRQVLFHYPLELVDSGVCQEDPLHLYVSVFCFGLRLDFFKLMTSGPQQIWWERS